MWLKRLSTVFVATQRNSAAVAMNRKNRPIQKITTAVSVRAENPETTRRPYAAASSLASCESQEGSSKRSMCFRRSVRDMPESLRLGPVVGLLVHEWRTFDHLVGQADAVGADVGPPWGALPGDSTGSVQPAERALLLGSVHGVEWMKAAAMRLPMNLRTLASQYSGSGSSDSSGPSSSMASSHPLTDYHPIIPRGPRAFPGTTHRRSVTPGRSDDAVCGCGVSTTLQNHPVGARRTRVGIFEFMSSRTGPSSYDPTLYKGSAPFYLRGRPPYSLALRETVAVECGLDGTGRLLDVGCGPGVLAVELAPLFQEAVGLDPDTDMLAEAARHAGRAQVTNIRWVQSLAEEILALDLGRFRLVTFGQSFHRTDRERVAEAVYDLLEPGGCIALVAPTVDGRPKPPGPGHPEIPHEAIQSLIDKYLGPQRRAGQGFAPPPVDRYEDALARTRFGKPRHVFAPGRADIVQDVDGVLANYLSMSFAAPHLFGDRLELFEAEVRQMLTGRFPAGLFWDWPGDTEVVIAAKPR